MTATRTGFGYDAHAFGGAGPVTLGGVSIPHTAGIDATSDGDVLAHAISDAVLGVAARADIGHHFPSDATSSVGANSLDMLRICVVEAAGAGWRVTHVDATIIVQDVRISPHRDGIRTNLAAVLGVDREAVSVKATTTDRLGWIGAGEGIAVYAVVSAELVEG